MQIESSLPPLEYRNLYRWAPWEWDPHLLCHLWVLAQARPLGVVFVELHQLILQFWKPRLSKTPVLQHLCRWRRRLWRPGACFRTVVLHLGHTPESLGKFLKIYALDPMPQKLWLIALRHQDFLTSPQMFVMCSQDWETLSRSNKHNHKKIEKGYKRVKLESLESTC